jgi:hypothetical protein
LRTIDEDLMHDARVYNDKDLYTYSIFLFSWSNCAMKWCYRITSYVFHLGTLGRADLLNQQGWRFVFFLIGTCN